MQWSIWGSWIRTGWTHYPLWIHCFVLCYQWTFQVPRLPATAGDALGHAGRTAIPRRASSKALTHSVNMGRARSPLLSRRTRHGGGGASHLPEYAMPHGIPVQPIRDRCDWQCWPLMAVVSVVRNSHLEKTQGLEEMGPQQTECGSRLLSNQGCQRELRPRGPHQVKVQLPCGILITMHLIGVFKWGSLLTT